MKANQLFNNSDVLALDNVLGGGGKITLKGSSGDQSIEMCYEWK